MKSLYARLSVLEREEISRGFAQGISLRSIARKLGRHPSSISREVTRVRRNYGYYRSTIAHEYACEQGHKPKKKKKLDAHKHLRAFVINGLKQYWSPEQIARKLIMVYPNDMIMRISHETIYQYLYLHPRGQLKEVLIKYLRHQHQTRKKRRRKRNCLPIKDFMSIDQRPQEVESRHIPGHWEGDLIVSGGCGGGCSGALGTLVERTTRMVFLVKLKNKDAESVRRAFTRVFKKLPPSMAKTLTYDQGREMAQHKLFTKNTNMNVYFAHPRSPWQRGSNENTNGLLRQFFPKGTNFDTVSHYMIKRAQRLLNTRPRKTLNWLSPSEAFEQLLH